MIQSRRTFLTGLSASIIAAPAIVRAASLMPVRGIVQPIMSPETIALAPDLYSQLCDVTRRAFVPRLFVQVYDVSPLGNFIHELENNK